MQKIREIDHALLFFKVLQLLFVEVKILHVLVIGEWLHDLDDRADIPAHINALHADRAELFKTAAHAHITVAGRKYRRVLCLRFDAIFRFRQFSVLNFQHSSV